MIGSSPWPMAIGAVAIGRGTILVCIAEKMFAVTLERAGSSCVGTWMEPDEPEMTMAADRLPRVRELSAPASNIVMLGRIGALLRAEYSDLLSESIPEPLTALISRLSARG